MTTPSDNDLSTSPKQFDTGGVKGQPGQEAPISQSRLVRLQSAMFHAVCIAGATFALLLLVFLAFVPKWPMNSIALVFIIGSIICVATIGYSIEALYKHIEQLVAENRMLDILNGLLSRENNKLRASKAGEVDTDKTPNGPSVSADRSITFPISSHPKWKGF